MEERKHDIVKDAYYLISKFLDAGKDITNLQVQKLMYFFEKTKRIVCFFTTLIALL